jgi:hypothetical protein
MDGAVKNAIWRAHKIGECTRANRDVVVTVRGHVHGSGSLTVTVVVANRLMDTSKGFALPTGAP